MKYALFALALLLIACTASGEDVSTKRVVGDVATRGELARLGVLIDQRSATTTDFATLEGLVAGDEDATTEVGEIKALVMYGEYTHAGHGIGFLDSYLATGNELLCPGHALAHYYVFSRHNDEHRAEHALEEAEEQFDEWKEKGAEYDAQFPGAQPFDVVAATVEKYLDAAREGATDAPEEDITMLATALCVES
jgi:hypothetical protein